MSSKPSPTAGTTSTSAAPEQASRGLDPPRDEARRLAHEALDRGLDELYGLSDRPVSADVVPEVLRASIDEPLPRRGRGPDDTLEFLWREIVPNTTRVHHPRFHGFIPGPGSFYGLVAKIIEAACNPFVGSWLGGKAFSELETTTLRWIAESIGYTPNATGIFTSGGSAANLNGLAAARTTLDAGDQPVIYTSDQTHSSLEKAARLLGFPEGSLRVIASDECFRIRLDELESSLRDDRRSGRRPLFLNANAGTTNTGAIDPLPELAEIAAEHDLWLHADAAYGGFAVLCEQGRTLLRGLERADSLTLDPHKWLYAPMGTGCFLTRRTEALEQAFGAGGDYLQDVPRTEVNYFERGIELSRSARALPVWFLMRTVGVERLAHEIAEDLRLAKVAEAWLLEDPAFELAAPTVLSVVSFRHRRGVGETEESRSARDRELMRRTLEAGEVMVSTTELRGRTALRLVVLNHRTDEGELRRSVDAIRRQRVTIS